MNNNEYKFDVNASIEQAERNINQLMSQLDKLQSIADKGIKGDHILKQGDVDNAVHAYKDMLRTLKETEKQYEGIAKASQKSGNNDMASQSRKNMEALNAQLNKSRMLFSQVSDSMTKMNSSDTTYVRYQKMYNNELTETQKRMRAIREMERDARLTSSRIERGTTRATQTGRMDYNGFQRLRGDVGRSGEFEAKQKNNESAMGSLRDKFKELEQSLSNTNKEYASSNMSRGTYKNQSAKLKDQMNEIQKEIELRKRANETLKDYLNTSKSAQSTTTSENIKVDPDKNSAKGIISSRSTAIALAGIGAVTGALGSIYSRGKNVESSIRGDSIQIGQQSGVGDYRAYKRSIAEIGVDSSTGYNAKQMMGWMHTAIGGQGNIGAQGNLDTAKALAQASRGTPVTSETLQSFMESSMQNGAVQGANGVKDITKLVAGSSQVGGMQGREDEMLKALQEIADNTFAGRNGSKEELQNVMAMQTMLSSTGNKSVQGTAGAQLQSSISSGIRNMSDDSPIATWLGKGTSYQGLGGMWQMQKMKEKGLTTESLGNLVQGSTMYGAEGSDAQKYAFQKSLSSLGVNASTDQVNSLMDVYTKYGSNSKEAKKMIDSMNKKGSDSVDKNTESYKNSSEGARNKKDAGDDYQALKTADNKLTDSLVKVENAVNQLPTPLKLLTVAVTALTATMGASMVMSGGSSMLRKVFSTQSAKDVSAGEKFGTSIFNNLKNTKVGAKLGEFSVGGVSLADLGSKVSSKSSSTVSKLGEFFTKSSTGSTIASTASKAGSTLSKGTKLLGKMALPVGLLASGYNIATAKDKASAIGEEAGGWGGTALGASIGTMVAPGVGTLIGGGIGMLAGSSVGKGVAGLGKKAVNGVKSFFNGTNYDKKDDSDFGLMGKAWNGISHFFTGNTAEASELSADERKSMTGDSISTKDKKSTTNIKASAEKLRASNILEEKNNLSVYAKLLVKAERILATAKSQNGIFGNGSGSSSSGSSSSGKTAGGSLNYVDEGKYWTTDDAKTHDLGYTVQGLTADSLNKWIAGQTGGNSKMDGLGDTFLKAGEESGLDPRYLVAHAALETGWGSSQLSKNGDPDTGNWFGIGAFDSNPENGENYGNGIIGGAKWIADNFYKNGQTSLETMRHNNGSHEYATDPNWDSKIASTMETSKQYTGASVKNEVNVTVTAGSNDSAEDIGRKVGNSASSTITTNLLDYYTRETKRS